MTSIHVCKWKKKTNQLTQMSFIIHKYLICDFFFIIINTWIYLGIYLEKALFIYSITKQSIICPYCKTNRSRLRDQNWSSVLKYTVCLQYTMGVFF